MGRRGRDPFERIFQNLRTNQAAIDLILSFGGRKMPENIEKPMELSLFR